MCLVPPLDKFLDVGFWNTGASSVGGGEPPAGVVVVAAVAAGAIAADDPVLAAGSRGPRAGMLGSVMTPATARAALTAAALAAAVAAVGAALASNLLRPVGTAFVASPTSSPWCAW